MISKENMRPIQGTLHLTAYDEQNCKIWQLSESNMIVSGAYDITAEALAGLASAKIVKVAVGINGTPPKNEDTLITNPVITDIQTIEYPKPGTVRFNFIFGYNDAVGMSICEFGLLSADGRLFARKVRQPIEKSKYASIVGAWEITI